MACWKVCWLLAGLLSAASIFAAEPKYQFTLKRSGDSLAASRQEQATVFTITSPTGIGAASIVRSEGPWPREVKLRMRLAPGKGLKALEHFELVSGRMKLAGTHGHSGKLPFYLADADGKFPNDDANPTGTVNVTFALGEESLDVTLPAHLLTGDRVEIVWIDFYRG